MVLLGSEEANANIEHVKLKLGQVKAVVTSNCIHRMTFTNNVLHALRHSHKPVL